MEEPLLQTASASDAYPVSTCVLILGMHRSGTSSLAGSLQKRGLFLDEVFEQNPHNAKGNRENRHVMRLNELVLAASGGAWDKPPMRIAWTDELERTRDALVRNFSDSGRPVWGFKDPRTLVTWPFWQPALHNVRFAGTFRHPLLTAQSLNKRSGMPLKYGLSLWRQYNWKLLVMWDRYRFPVISFDAEPGEYGRAVGRVATELGLDGGAGPDGFFENELRHQREPLDESLLEADDRKVYGMLREIHAKWAMV